MAENISGVKKSFYLFLTALLGVLIFMMLHRIGVFIYLYMLGTGVISTDMSYYQFVIFEYFSLTIVMMLGAWYGIWLGMYWFKIVYEEKSHGGFVHHVARHYVRPQKPAALETRVSAVKKRLEEDFSQMENLASRMAALSEPEPKLRKVVRKRAPKKLNSVK